MITNMTTMLVAGAISFYGLSPTVGTLQARQDMGHIPMDVSSYDVFLAVADCGLVGRSGTLISGDEMWNALVYDCSGDLKTTGWMGCEITEHLHECAVGFEADYYFWQEHPDMLGEKAVLVLNGGWE